MSSGEPEYYIFFNDDFHECGGVGLCSFSKEEEVITFMKILM